MINNLLNDFFSVYINMLSLTDRIVESLSKKDISEMRKLKNICDILHKGGNKDNYTPNDMPSDEKYEEMCNYMNDYVKSLKSTLNIKNDFGAHLRKDNNMVSNDTNHFKHNIERKSNDIIMDGIILPPVRPTIDDCIVMPKFDGCAIGLYIRFNSGKYYLYKAHTRGSDSLTGVRVSNDLTEKINMIFEANEAMNNLLKEETININVKDKSIDGNLNTPIFKTIYTNKIEEIRIRAEVVKKDKSTNETAVGFVAGAVNGGMDIWKAKCSNICIVPYEIALLETCEEKYIPTQIDSLEILDRMKLLTYEYDVLDKLDLSTNLIEILDKYIAKTKQPLDGLVYCNINWTYPQNSNENSKKVGYEKYKFKRDTIAQSTITGVEYSIGATGKYTCMLTYMPVKIGDKMYKRAKTAFGKIEKFGQIGVGTICDIELVKDINPTIKCVYNNISNITEPITPPVNCIYCNSKLIRNKNKQEDVTLVCNNTDCIGINRMKVLHLLETFKYKGIGEKTLIDINYTCFDDLWNSKLSSESKAQIRSKAKVKPKPTNSVGFKELILRATTKTMLIALGIGTATSVNKLLSKNKLNGEMGFIQDFDKVSSFIGENYSDDAFINDFMMFIVDKIM